MRGNNEKSKEVMTFNMEICISGCRNFKVQNGCNLITKKHMFFYYCSLFWLFPTFWHFPTLQTFWTLTFSQFGLRYFPTLTTKHIFDYPKFCFIQNQVCYHYWQRRLLKKRRNILSGSNKYSQVSVTDHEQLSFIVNVGKQISLRS